jgi:peptidyl-tRNA hydrolase
MKMYCIFSSEAIAKMGGNRGKMAAHSGHAFEGALANASRKARDEYFATAGRPKIALIATEDEINVLHAKYKTICGADLIIDAAHTVFKEPTLTALGIGPIRPDQIGDDLKALKVFI